DWQINSTISRNSTGEVYQQIKSDLQEAQTLLSEKYLKSDLINNASDRVRPTKWAATALLARTYLYTGDWSSAEVQATSVITNSLYSLGTLNNAFIKNSSEAIWQLQPVTANPSNTWEGFLFVLPSAGPNASNYPVYLNSNLVNSFEPGDQRKINW